MGMRFNPAPGWPPVPEGYAPPPGWQPDPAWPPAPEGWQLWVDDGQLPASGLPAAQFAGRTSGKAVAALVLGILGFSVVTACLGIVFGIIALANIRARIEYHFGTRGELLVEPGGGEFAVTVRLPDASPDR